MFIVLIRLSFNGVNEAMIHATIEYRNINIFFRGIEWVTMMMGYNENGNQNMPMNRFYFVSFLTSSAPIESLESQLSIGGNPVKNGAI